MLYLLISSFAIDDNKSNIDCSMCTMITVAGRRYLGDKPGVTPKTLESFLRQSCKLMPRLAVSRCETAMNRFGR